MLKLESWQDPGSSPYIVFENIYKSYNNVPVLNNFNLSVYKGEFFSLLGESACGKTSVLRLLSGLESPDRGRIYIDNIDITDMSSYERPVNMMFQSYALFPHMNVKENIAFGLKEKKVDKQEIAQRISDILKLVQLHDVLFKHIDQLSGGEKQRVALARCLINKPKVLLLDEPLAALDKTLREKTQIELCNIQEAVNTTFIMVTHDQEEAMTVSSRIGILHQGNICQIGTPSEIYEYPNSTHVAEKIGSANILSGVVQYSSEYTIVSSPQVQLPLKVHQSSSAALGANVFVVIRPEKVMISKNRPSEEQKFNFAVGTVEDILYLGDVSIYYVKVLTGQIILASQTNYMRLSERPVTWDDEVFISWDPLNCLILSK